MKQSFRFTTTTLRGAERTHSRGDHQQYQQHVPHPPPTPPSAVDSTRTVVGAPALILPDLMSDQQVQSGGCFKSSDLDLPPRDLHRTPSQPDVDVGDQHGVKNKGAALLDDKRKATRRKRRTSVILSDEHDTAAVDSTFSFHQQRAHSLPVVRLFKVDLEQIHHTTRQRDDEQDANNDGSERERAALNGVKRMRAMGKEVHQPQLQQYQQQTHNNALSSAEIKERQRLIASARSRRVTLRWLRDQDDHHQGLIQQSRSQPIALQSSFPPVLEFP